jgi:hypothetical protein
VSGGRKRLDEWHIRQNFAGAHVFGQQHGAPRKSQQVDGDALFMGFVV